MMDPETMKKAAEMMKSMSPEELRRMASHASQMSSFGAAGGMFPPLSYLHKVDLGDSSSYIFNQHIYSA